MGVSRPARLALPLLCVLVVCWVAVAHAQEAVLKQDQGAEPPGASAAREPADASPPPAVPEPPEAPGRVEIRPAAPDEDIATRLARILEATGWFIAPGVDVRDGVVFLGGRARTADQRKWAGDLARNTQDVVAVVNRIEVVEPPLWDFSPALATLREIWRASIRVLPLLVLGLFILVLAWWLAGAAGRAVRRPLRTRLVNELLGDVIARVVSIAVLVLGLFLVLQLAGLTSVALALLGGTGLIGIILGIAFREITENFLASLFLSLQNPFREGDLVEIAGVSGFVQRLTTRATVLMTLEGNHVQVPNATVYKSNIRNFTSNPRRRVSFGVELPYSESIRRVQEVALRAVAEHPVVLHEPEPLALAENLGPAFVTLRIHFWMDGEIYSVEKTRSAVMRLVKRSLQQAGVVLPPAPPALAVPPAAPGVAEPERSTATSAEGGLRSEAPQIEAQGRQARSPEEGANLLRPAPARREDGVR